MTGMEAQSPPHPLGTNRQLWSGLGYRTRQLPRSTLSLRASKRRENRVCNKGWGHAIKALRALKAHTSPRAQLDAAESLLEGNQPESRAHRPAQWKTDQGVCKGRIPWIGKIPVGPIS
jgi:hypothetical protein